MYATRKNVMESGRRTSQGFVSSNSRKVEYEEKSNAGGYCLLFVLAAIAVVVLFYISTIS